MIFQELEFPERSTGRSCNFWVESLRVVDASNLRFRVEKHFTLGEEAEKFPQAYEHRGQAGCITLE